MVSDCHTMSEKAITEYMVNMYSINYINLIPCVNLFGMSVSDNLRIGLHVLIQLV